MAAIIDPGELQNAQTQIGMTTPPVAPPAGMAAASPGAGPILDPDELAHIQKQLQSGATPQVNAAPATVPPLAPVGSGEAMGPAPDRGVMGAADDAMRMITAGIPFSDRFSAAMNTLTGAGLPGADYAKNLADERSKNAWLASEYPGLSKLLGFGGGTAAIVAAAPEEAVAAPTALGRALYGTATGGIAGAAEGASSAPDLTKIPDVLQRTGIGTLVGASTGAALPLAASGIGNVYEAGANALTGGVAGVSRAAAAPLRDAIAADTPQAVLAANKELGPYGMLVDTGPSLLGKGQGVTLNSDEARTQMVNAISGRSDPSAISQRVLTDVDAALGPAPPSAKLASAMIQAQKAPFSAQLGVSYATAPDVDIAPVLSHIDSIKTAEGTPLEFTLGTIRKFLTTSGQDAQGNPIRVPVTDAETLNRAREAIDGMIDYGPQGIGPLAGADADAQGTIKNLRYRLSRSLKDQVPGYEAAMDGLATLNRQQANILKGTQSLRGGQASINPNDFENDYGPLPQGPTVPGTLPPVNGPGAPLLRTPEQAATNLGMRAAIDTALRSNPNDYIAVKRLLQGEEGGNAQNIGTAFGPEARSALLDTVNREGTFTDTDDKIVQKSQTAQRTAAAAAMKPEAATGGIPYINPNMTLTGAAMTPIRRMGQALVSQFRPDPTRSYGEIARVLTAQGPQRDAYTSALIDSLNRRAANAAAARGIGNAGALGAALIGGQAANRRLLGPSTGTQQ